MSVQNFRFYNPTKIYFGKDQIKAIDREIPQESKVLILYGGGSVKRFGTFDKVVAALGEREWDEFGGIEANPVYETLMSAVERVKSEGFNYLLAIGGGSVIDGTKFVAAAAEFNGEPIDIFGKGVGRGLKVKSALPLGTVLTMPATGSEMNKFSVVTFKELNAKVSFASDKVYPSFSILDPEITFSLPKRQLANGISDAFIHTMEDYMTYPVDAKVQDRYAEGILQTLIEESQTYVDETLHDYASAANVMWAATNALNGFISAGVPGDWSTHALGHEITVLNNSDHARTLTPILLATMEVRKKAKWEKLLQYADRIWGITGGEEEARIDAAIDKTREFFQSIGMPTKISELGVTEKDVDQLVDQLVKHGNGNTSERGDQTADVSRKIYLTAL